MTSRGQCPRGGGACECLDPPLQEILYPRLVFHPSKFRPLPPTWMAGYGPAGLHLPLLAGWGGNDKLAIDKGGNLPEKVENHCCRRSVPNRASCCNLSVTYASIGCPSMVTMPRPRVVISWPLRDWSRKPGWSTGGLRAWTQMFRQTSVRIMERHAPVSTRALRVIAPTFTLTTTCGSDAWLSFPDLTSTP